MSVVQTPEQTGSARQRPPFPRRTAGVVLGGLLLLIAVAVALSNRGAPAETASEPLPVACTQPAPVTSAWSHLRLTGILRAPRVSELAFGRGEILHEVVVDEGQRVERGQLLARLDPRRISAQREQAAAALAQARALLAEFEQGPRAETLSAARAAVRQAEAEVTLWAKKVSRRDQLVEGGVAAEEEGDENVARLAVARAQLDVRRAQLDELETGTRAERLVAQRAQVDQLLATQRAVESDWEDARMVAPYAGFVAAIRAQVGEVIVPGAPIVRLVEDAALEAWIGVPPRSAVTPGVRTEVDVDGRRIGARVESILPELDPVTRTQTVVLVLDRDASLRPGRVASWSLPSPAPPSGYTLPLGALTRGERDTWSVFVAAADGDGFVVERRRVQVEGSDGERAWIVGDVAPDDAVVADGAHRVVPGQRVIPRDQPSDE